MGDAAEAHALIATHENRGKMLQATQALVSGQVVIKEEPFVIVTKEEPSPVDLFRAFMNHNQSIKDTILVFYSPTDGRAAESLTVDLHSHHN